MGEAATITKDGTGAPQETAFEHDAGDGLGEIITQEDTSNPAPAAADTEAAPAPEPAGDEPTTEETPADTPADAPGKADADGKGAAAAKGGEEAAPGISPALVAEALGYGFTQETIKGFGTDAALDVALTAIDQRLKATQSAAVAVTPPVAAVAPAALPATAPAAAPAAGETAPKEEAFELKLNDDVVDPELATTLRAMHADHNKVVAGLKAELAEVRAAEQRREDKAFVKDFDGHMSALPEEWQAVIGKGPSAKMRSTSVLYQNRVKLLDMVDAIRNAEIARGAPETPLGELLKEDGVALRATFNVVQTKARADVRAEVERRNKATVTRPTDRKGNALTGLQAAMAKEEEFNRNFTFPTD